jgi:hypothetical protein
MDACESDADCPVSQVCSCGGALYGQASGATLHTCVPATCHVDADCGTCGFCSPSADPICGPTYGAGEYACHKPGDACVTDAQCSDAGAQFGSPFCSYEMTVAKWACGSSYCGG